MLTQLLVSLEVWVIQKQEDQVKTGKDCIRDFDVFHDRPRPVVVTCGRVGARYNATAC